ncbi:hypothetical protein [Candidatus Soleaferrea massiliensis]|uniref:hypothetical protein n=1 Tax=Candidatus Soleaferrea massiliensis TaxID=1470354 RepID=UPI0005915196|nr:hypothetical protein [Candidatus Soleaferrea massiliensis]
MLPECSAILLILIAIEIVFLRSKKLKSAIFVLPLGMVPLFHLLATGASVLLGRVWNAEPWKVIVPIDVIGLVATCLLLGWISGNIRKNKNKGAYLSMCAGFSTILSCVLLFHVFAG